MPSPTATTAVRLGSRATVAAKYCASVRGAAASGPVTGAKWTRSRSVRASMSRIGTAGSAATAARIRISRPASVSTVAASNNSVA
ncbi:Uncharacterised protein [Mycobacteroides abscessus subsp. abscessus]|nr:Uncharacterised protein [Mycobacteroides abscessus subsp. abscessus]